MNVKKDLGMGNQGTGIKGVLFDKDGTLFDFDATWGVWAARFLTQEAGGDPELAQILGDAVGYDMAQTRFRRSSVVVAGTPREIAEQLLPQLPSQPISELMDRMNTMAQQVPQVEVVPLHEFVLDLKARGLKIGVATNDAEAPARTHLERAGVEAHFDFVAGSDSGYGGKPSAGQLIAFCDAVGLAPEDCAMVGDSLHDLSAGQAAGMFRIGVLTGTATEQDLGPHCDLLLSSIGALGAWLDA